MSLEQTLERIAVALETIAANRAPVQNTPVAAPVAAPVKEVKKPVEVVIPVLIPEAAAPTPPVVAAPTVPTVTLAPVVASPSDDCPIKDGKGLMDYVMGAYRALGAEKGAKIQEVLNSIGCAAINEVRADQYAALHAGIEALKAA